MIDPTTLAFLGILVNFLLLSLFVLTFYYVFVKGPDVKLYFSGDLEKKGIDVTVSSTTLNGVFVNEGKSACTLFKGVFIEKWPDMQDLKLVYSELELPKTLEAEDCVLITFRIGLPDAEERKKLFEKYETLEFKISYHFKKEKPIWYRPKSKEKKIETRVVTKKLRVPLLS